VLMAQRLEHANGVRKWDTYSLLRDASGQLAYVPD
jgi:hypothetical protein